MKIEQPMYGENWEPKGIDKSDLENSSSREVATRNNPQSQLGSGHFNQLKKIKKDEKK